MSLEYRKKFSGPERIDTLPKEQVLDEDHPEWIIYQYTIEGTPVNVREDSEGMYHVQIPIKDALLRVVMAPGSAYAVPINGSVIDIFCPGSETE